MQFSSAFEAKILKLFPRAKGLHYKVQMGKLDVGEHIENFITEVTEEQFAGMFKLQPHQAQDQFPAYLEELSELRSMYENEVATA